MPDHTADLDAALAALAGLPLVTLARAGDTLWVHLGEHGTLAGEDGDTHVVGTHALHVSCPWRWVAPDRVVVGLGDLLTPADPEAELDDFDWDAPGASWLDVRLGELVERLAESPVSVRDVTRDAWLGLRLMLDDGSALECFPNSTPTGHVSTEFWRVLQPGRDAAHVVAGTFGVDVETM
jgi:hypothetical protein